MFYVFFLGTQKNINIKNHKLYDLCLCFVFYVDFEFWENPHTKVVGMCLKRVCPTWTIAQFRISAEIRPFEFGHILNVKWRIRI